MPCVIASQSIQMTAFMSGTISTRRLRGTSSWPLVRAIGAPIALDIRLNAPLTLEDHSIRCIGFS